MTKTELIEKVAETTKQSKASVQVTLDALQDAIVDAMKSGDAVTLVGFGTFEVRKTAERTGVNPRTKEKVTIPAGRKVAFRVGKSMKDAVK